MKLKLNRSQWEQMRAHVDEAAPEEACGLLGGLGGTVMAVFPVENADHSPVRFRMEPHAQVRLMMEIERRGWELLGIYHSHPAGPGAPSPTDIREAYYPEAIHVIWSRAGGEGWTPRAFEIAEGRAMQVDLEISDA